MVVGWLSHRTFTFACTTPPSVAEFLRYAGGRLDGAAINYGLFVLILLARPATEPLVALVASSLVAMFFAYLGMRLRPSASRPKPRATQPCDCRYDARFP